MTRAILSMFLLSAMMIPLFASAPVDAQDRELHVAIDPQSGRDGSTVTISGGGAPPNAEVVVSFSPWDQNQSCETPRGGDLVDTVIADARGEFSATHTARRFGDNHLGNTYVAFIPEVQAAEPMSTLACFEFELADQEWHFEATGHSVSGRFLDFWENNGDLPVFGFPISVRLSENGADVQYFERQRFELHPGNTPPFDVLLGHLGKHAAEARGLLDSREFQPAVDRSGTSESCVYFEQTSHNLCGVFLDHWQANGLDVGDDGVSHRESLMLFGYPISEEFTEPATGLTVQYFERAKLEYHPDNEAPWTVIPERLGTALYLR